MNAPKDWICVCCMGQKSFSGSIACDPAKSFGFAMVLGLAEAMSRAKAGAALPLCPEHATDLQQILSRLHVLVPLSTEAMARLGATEVKISRSS